jgi:hypothetical protein
MEGASEEKGWHTLMLRAFECMINSYLQEP